jgi:hypothetical protein
MTTVFKASDVQKGTKLPDFEKEFGLSRNQILNAAAAGELEVCVRVPDMYPVDLDSTEESTVSGYVRTALFVVERQVAGELLVDDPGYVPVRKFFVPDEEDDSEVPARSFIPSGDLRAAYNYLEVRDEEVARRKQKAEQKDAERAAEAPSAASSTEEERPMRSDWREHLLRTIGGLVSIMSDGLGGYRHGPGEPNVNRLAQKVAERSGAKERTVNGHIAEALKLLKDEAE